MIVRDHFQLSDQEFSRQFQELKIKPGLFTHEAHIRLAYIYILKYGLEKAEKTMCDQIKAFGAFHKSNGFNKTVTIAATKAVHHFMKKAESTNFEEFIKEFPRLTTSFKELIGKHYGFNVFSDPTAKKEYIAPDLLPF